MELFAGFSQNFAAIPSGVLGETDPQRFRNVEPETADNIEVGMRISRWPLTASVTLYNIKFDNRIVYLPAGFVSGIDYLGETDGVYENFGGVESNGLEAAFGYGWDNGWRLNAAYTYNCPSTWAVAMPRVIPSWASSTAPGDRPARTDPRPVGGLAG